MAAKKSKFSVYNNANKVVDRTMDGSKSVPKAKKGKSEDATAKTFNTKTKTTKKKQDNIMAMKKASAKKMMTKPAAKPAVKTGAMTAAQKQLPPFIQKAIAAKKTKKK